MKSCRCIATARASLRFKCCPGPRLQDLGPFTEESRPWSPRFSSGLPPLWPSSGIPRTRGTLVISDESRLVGVTSRFQASKASQPRHAGLQSLQVSRAFSCFGVPGGEADAPRALSPCGRPGASPPSQPMLRVPTFSLPWQCHVVRCPLSWVATSHAPMALTSTCPLQGCRRLLPHRRRPRLHSSGRIPTARSRGRAI